MNSNSDLFQAILAMDAYNRISRNVRPRNLVVADRRGLLRDRIQHVSGNASSIFGLISRNGWRGSRAVESLFLLSCEFAFDPLACVNSYARVSRSWRTA
jgi:hypothetical protein